VTVFICVNTSKYVGDAEHLKVFASEEAAERWFADHDPEGAVFEYPVLAQKTAKPCRATSYAPSRRTSPRLAEIAG